jgi:cytochrome c553
VWLLLIGVTLAEAADAVRVLTSSMHEHYDHLTAARDGVVAGDLAAVRAAGDELATLDAPEGLPPGWLSFVASVNAEAVLLRSATDLPNAATSVATTTVACGGCHSFTGKGPDLRKARAIPPQKWERGSNMQLHAWSLSWMWLGLIAHDDAAWERGANELVRQPIELMFERSAPDGERELEQLVYAAAGRALEQSDPAARAETYGALLGVCAQCHVKHPSAE